MRRLALFHTLLARALLAWALLACAHFVRGEISGAASLRVPGSGVVDGASYAPPVPPKLESVARLAGIHVAVAPAPVAERLPAVLPPLVGGGPLGLRHARCERSVPDGSSAGYVQIRVRRHVPRMDSGDPPRA